MLILQRPLPHPNFLYIQKFLEKHQTEAREMSIFEYDQEKHMRQELIQKKLDKGMPIAEIAADLEETEEHIRKIIADNKDFVHDKGDIR